MSGNPLSNGALDDGLAEQPDGPAHTFNLAAEFVRPFRKSRAAKNDRHDAEAVLIAVRQPNMRFVAMKTVEQQAIPAKFPRTCDTSAR